MINNSKSSDIELSIFFMEFKKAILIFNRSLDFENGLFIFSIPPLSVKSCCQAETPVNETLPEIEKKSKIVIIQVVSARVS